MNKTVRKKRINKEFHGRWFSLLITNFLSLGLSIRRGRPGSKTLFWINCYGCQLTIKRPRHKIREYRFWSVYSAKARGWLCIPPSKRYIPGGYPKKAVRKHKSELLPPRSYWLHPEYEFVVYQKH